MPKCIQAALRRQQAAQDAKFAKLMEAEWAHPQTLMYVPAQPSIVEALASFVREEMQRATGTDRIFGTVPHHPV